MADRALTLRLVGDDKDLQRVLGRARRARDEPPGRVRAIVATAEDHLK